MFLTKNFIENFRSFCSVKCSIHRVPFLYTISLSHFFPRILKKIALKEPREALEKADLRHIRTSAYCCFLPDLTRFTASHCAGPKPCQAKLFKGNFYFQSVYPSYRNFMIAMAQYIPAIATTKVL